MVPITFDDACSPSKSSASCKTGDSNIGVDINGDNCFKTGTPIKINYIPPPSCASCSNATCKVVVSNGADLTSARSQSTTDMTAQESTKKNTIFLKDDGVSKTICVPVNVPSDATTFGFKHAMPAGYSTGCSLTDPDITRSYTLVPSTCAGPNINPKTPNGGKVGSGFNPEWDVVSSAPGAGQLVPGDYVFCFTIKVNPGSLCSSIPYLTLGAYSNGTPCAANNGTSTVKINGATPSATKNPSKNSYILCYNDKLDITTTGANPGTDYGIFVNAPTGNDLTTQTSSFTKEYFNESLNSMSETSLGNNSAIFGFIAGLTGVPKTVTNNTIWWVPISTATAGILSDPNCYNMDYQNEAYKVTYLNDIKLDTATDCSNSKFKLTISGGSPEFVAGSKYTITTNKGTLDASTLSTSGGSVYLSGLNSGDQFTLSITDGVGCTKQVTGKYYCPCSVPTVSGTLVMCVGEQVTLTGSGTAATTNPWTASNTNVVISGTGQTRTIVGKTAGSTDITYKDNSGCSKTVTVTINGNPTLTANPTSILVSATSAITVTGGSGTAAASNAWVSSSVANATIVGAGQSATVTGVAVGNSNIIYTDNKGCDDTVQVTVTVPGCQTISNPSPAQVLCQGSDPSPFKVSTSETAANSIYFVVYPAMFKPANAAAVYSGINVTGVAISNKLTPSAGTASIDLPPLGTLGSLPVTISGDYYVYAILDPAPTDVNCRPYAEIKVTIKDSVIPVITSGALNSNSSTFTWNDIPTANKFGVDTARIASTIPPTAWKSAVSIVNSTGGLGNTFTFNNIPLGQTAHIKITPQDNSGTQMACSNTAMSSITNPNCTKPIPLALTAPSLVCEGTALSILGSLDPSSVPSNFKWRISSDGVNWSDVSGPDFDVTTSPSTLSIPKTRFFMNKNFVKLVVTDKATGVCKDSTLPVKILVNELPNASLSINPDPAKICIGTGKLISVTFLGNKGVPPYVFDYTLDGSIRKDSSLASSSVLTYDFKTDRLINDSTFVLTTVTDKNGCSSAITINNTVKMQVLPVLKPLFVADQTIGCYPFKVIFSDKSSTKSKEVSWDFGDGSPVSKDSLYTSYIFKKAGDFTITFKSTLNGCSDTMVKTEYIHVKDRPKAQFSPKITNISMIDPEIQFVNTSSSNSVYYKWIFGDGSPVSNLVNPKHTFIGQGNNGLPDPGKYVVELYAYVNQDCWDSTSTTITIDDEQIYYIPNTFTPNGDEKNNLFQPIFTSGYDPQNYHFLIYNRWGEIVFESNNPAIGWDGTFGSKMLSNETFTWKLQFKERLTEKEHYLTGHVNLIK